MGESLPSIPSALNALYSSDKRAASEFIQGAGARLASLQAQVAAFDDFIDYMALRPALNLYRETGQVEKPLAETEKPDAE